MVGLQLTGHEGKTAYLKGWDECHAYSLCLTQADRAGMVRMAVWTVDQEDLEYYERRLQDFVVKHEVIPKDYRRDRALSFQAPSGHTIGLLPRVARPHGVKAQPGGNSEPSLQRDAPNT
jgi:hypothetical protein